MAILLPKFIVIRSVNTGLYLRYITEPNNSIGNVSNSMRNVFDTFNKIEVERAKINSRYVHLRFSHTNKYWGRTVSGNTPTLHASSSKPEEDLSKQSCTLFEPFRGSDGIFSFTHVQSGGICTNPRWGGIIRLNGWGIGTNVEVSFTVIDWDTIVTVPKYVTFKGDNDSYLRGVVVSRTEYLQFSSSDGNQLATGYEVTMNPNGFLRIKSNMFDKFWRRSPNWVWANSTDTSSNDVDTLFWPVRISGNIIALRSAGNNSFCRRLASRGNTKDCLSAAEPTISAEARLQVEELVLDREIFDVRFRMGDSRVYDETVIVAGDASAQNNTYEVESSKSIAVKYEQSRTYSFSNTLSIMTGVSTSLQTGVPFIVKGEIEISAEITNTFEWNRGTSETWSAEATYVTDVPPRSRVTVEYVATVGRCDVPFSYTQRDRLSHTGRIVTTQHDDGIYTGVNYYGFQFNQPKIQPL